MLREVRIVAPGVLHHIICHSIERRQIFKDDADRDSFVKRILGNSDFVEKVLYDAAEKMERKYQLEAMG
jgi:hypothetical protein